MLTDEINIIKHEITTKGIDVFLIEYKNLKRNGRYLATWCREDMTDEDLERRLPRRSAIEYAKSPTYWAKFIRAFPRATGTDGYPPLTLKQAEKKFSEMCEAVQHLDFNLKN